MKVSENSTNDSSSRKPSDEVSPEVQNGVRSSLVQCGVTEECLNEEYVKMGLEGFVAQVTKTIQDLTDEEVSDVTRLDAALSDKEEPLRRSLRQAQEDLEKALERVRALEGELAKLRREYADSYLLYQKRILRG